MKKIKVVHIITKLELGGAQINTIYTYKNLNPEEFETYLVCGPGGILTNKIEKSDRFIIIEGLQREINPVKDLKTFFQVFKVLKKINPDIVHTHSSKAGIIGRMIAFILKVPVIIHSVHGFSFSPFQSFLKRNFFMVSEKIVSKLTTHFIFVSNDDIKLAKQKKLVKNNYTLIRSGFQTGRFSKKSSDLTYIRKKYNIKDKDLVCGVIAPFKPQKGLFHLIEIASMILKKRKDVIFFIAGDGKLREEIEYRLREKRISENFKLPGFIFDIENAIDIFDIGISTALWEGLPQSLIQMRLKKKPIVASNISGNIEVIKHNENGYLIDVFDYIKFSEKILFLINNKKERERLSNFKEDFSEWDADFMVKAQERLYLLLGKN
jgi:glycosyltransferase involved in cell wall biosynthesis